MADLVKNPVVQGVKVSGMVVKNGRGKRQSREARGLEPLTSQQRQIVRMIQNAENACKFIKKAADAGEAIPKDTLAACSVLSTALGNLIGA
jgi:hypothetical protein